MLKKISLGLFALFLIYAALSAYKTLWGYGALMQVPTSQISASENADLTVVEFLDYQCIYCQQMHPTLKGAIERDRKIAFTIRPIALLNEQSKVAAKMVYAADRQQAFWPMHEALIGGHSDFSDAGIKALVQSLGLDLAQFNQDIDNDLIQSRLAENVKIFRALGGNGTPTIFIGRRVRYTPIDRMPTIADFLSMFNDARAKGYQ